MVPVLQAAPDLNAVAAPKKVECASTILLATDGTAQSEHAVSAARLIGKRIGSDVNVLTVVDQLPIPWSGFDAKISAEYERRLAADAENTVALQLSKFGARLAYRVESQCSSRQTVTSSRHRERCCRRSLTSP